MIKTVEAIASLGKVQDPAMSGQYKAYILVLLTAKAIFTRLYYKPVAFLCRKFLIVEESEGSLHLFL